MPDPADVDSDDEPLMMREGRKEPPDLPGVRVGASLADRLHARLPACEYSTGPHR
jgi:hypothetical protein